MVSAVGFKAQQLPVKLLANENKRLAVELEVELSELEQVVVSGTLSEVTRANSLVPVEVYSEKFLLKNPTQSIFEAMRLVNGLRPQINCSVCQTGDIHMNGLEGAYTLVMIDGMPLVSGLSTVYGLTGIPPAMIERVEVVKGPASALYGSEAVGGLINVITKNPLNTPAFSADFFTTSWAEHNLNLSLKTHLGKWSILNGASGLWYQNPEDQNADGFTDITLQKRLSLFQKWSLQRPDNKPLSIGLRYFTENRWGGELDWEKQHRGGTEIYGESIITDRYEVFGKYALPTKLPLLFTGSFNHHYQDSFYGDMAYEATQQIGFGQLTWQQETENSEWLAGTALRYTYYNDNTPATAIMPERVWLPGVFVQNIYSPAKKHQLLSGLRADHHSEHGVIFTPRVGYRYKASEQHQLRLNAGTGFRVVSVFTEDHAALTGAREVVFTEALNPEQSYNINLNYNFSNYSTGGTYFRFDITGWYTYFTNQILPDYDTDPNKIFYRNLGGYANSKGISVDFALDLPIGLVAQTGVTFSDARFFEDENSAGERPYLSERFMGTWSISYPLRKLNLSVDYTGSVYGPMRLPLLGEMDDRPAYSPFWSLQNIQFTYNKPNTPWQVYGGVKNLLDYTPPRNSIARSHDPFDRQVVFADDGSVVPSADNPNALTFDPSYVFAPNQGRHTFVGVRFTVR